MKDVEMEEGENKGKGRKEDEKERRRARSKERVRNNPLSRSLSLLPSLPPSFSLLLFICPSFPSPLRSLDPSLSFSPLFPP